MTTICHVSVGDQQLRHTTTCDVLFVSYSTPTQSLLTLPHPAAVTFLLSLPHALCDGIAAVSVCLCVCVCVNFILIADFY